MSFGKIPSFAIRCSAHLPPADIFQPFNGTSQLLLLKSFGIYSCINVSAVL